MFDLVICDELNSYLREIRKDLKNKGYSKCNRYIGTMHLNYVYEYYTRAKTRNWKRFRT